MAGRGPADRGVYAALSAIWLDITGERGDFWALTVLGGLVAVSSLVSLARPGLVATKWLTPLFRVLLFVAPGGYLHRPERCLVDVVGRRRRRAHARPERSAAEQPGAAALTAGQACGTGPGRGTLPLPWQTRRVGNRPAARQGISELRLSGHGGGG